MRSSPPPRNLQVCGKLSDLAKVPLLVTPCFAPRPQSPPTWVGLYARQHPAPPQLPLPPQTAQVPPPASRHASPPSPAPGRSPQRGSGFTPDNILPLRNYRSLPKPPKSDRLLVPPPPVAMLRPRPLPPGRSPQRGSGFTPDNILPLRNYRSLPNRQTAQPSPNPPLIPPRAPPFFHRASASVHSPRSTFPRPPTKVLHPNLVNFHPVLSGMTIVSLSSHSKL